MEYILGVFVSLSVEGLKSKYGADGMRTMTILTLASVGAAVIYAVLSANGYWSTLAQILTTAGAFHNFIIRQIEREK
jgi:hypothetical protein